MSEQALLEITAYELASYLLKNGHVEKASGLLKDLIVKDPKAVTARCVRALAQIAYECKSWPDAEALWRVASGAEPSNAEAWVKLAHSLVELGRQAEAEGCAAKAKSLMASRPKDAASSAGDDWLAGIHEQICLSFLGNALPKAADLVRMFSLPGTYLGNVTPGQNGRDRGSSLQDADIHKRLQDALTRWEAGGRMVPYLQQRGAALANDPIPGALPARKVLLVLRRYFLGRADSRLHELGVFIETSAKATGLEATFFPADPFLNPTAIQPDQQYSELDRLGRTILSTKPDLVIFDDLCNQEPPAEYITPEVYKNVFRALKEHHPFKLVSLYPDSWMTKSWFTMEFASSFLDVLWPLNFFPPATGAEIPGVKIFWAPIPYPEALFQPRSSGKDIGAAFVGSLFDYNSPRGIWLTLLKSRGIPCQLFLSTHTTSGSRAGATPEEYAAFMSRLRISVNFSARATGRKIMTGRAWESIIARALLLEEDNEEIKRFFVPFVHYVPFTSMEELQAYLSFFERHENARRAIAERAYQWFLQLFSKERIWRDLISIALR
ncbi:MAG: glycosyltransferase [Verrucomicrobia bacterium]|nr:glycosyltransferase [Verrucomicrobiota bacterium]